MPIGSAIGIGALGSIGSALIGSNASKKASQQQAAMLQQALELQKQYLGPYVQAGQGVLPILQQLLTPGANMTQVLSQIPGFTFAQDWGQKAVKNLGTTMGLGGNVLTAGADYATGKAQQGYGGIVNALQNFANMGSSAASSAGTMGSNTLSAIGGAQAAGTLGSANALATGIQGLGNAALNYSLINRLTQQGGGGVYGIPSYQGSDWVNAGQGTGPWAAG
jgi:hypothetical protein